MSKWEDNSEIKLFREYLRIPSVHPDIDYSECSKFASQKVIHKFSAQEIHT